MDCVFCEQPEKVLYENAYVYAMYDRYPVSEGHVLIIPKRHVEHYFEATKEVRHAIDDALIALKKELDKLYHPDGYNVGINNGLAAGQTIFHLHVHLIPRYKNDMENPAGGVRGVIPSKQKYT